MTSALKPDKHQREYCAKLVDAMLNEVPWKYHMWARGALAIAARAIRRGRNLTDEEKMSNLMKAIFVDDEQTRD
jgi:hypothetical protein